MVNLSFLKAEGVSYASDRGHSMGNWHPEPGKSGCYHARCTDCGSDISIGAPNQLRAGYELNGPALVFACGTPEATWLPEYQRCGGC